MPPAQPFYQQEIAAVVARKLSDRAGAQENRFGRRRPRRLISTSPLGPSPRQKSLMTRLAILSASSVGRAPGCLIPWVSQFEVVTHPNRAARCLWPWALLSPPRACTCNSRVYDLVHGVRPLTAATWRLLQHPAGQAAIGRHVTSQGARQVSVCPVSILPAACSFSAPPAWLVRTHSVFVPCLMYRTFGTQPAGQDDPSASADRSYAGAAGSVF